MSITNPKVIDFWAIPKDPPDSLLLVMTDHLEWGNKAEQGEHLLLLQEKINSYIAFIEGGQIYTEIPGAYGKYPIIQVVGLYELPEQAEYFMARVTETLNDVGIGFKFELRADERIRNM
ncbi:MULTISPECIES: DUF6572 domain-containing protein [Pseudomonas chlororaphis group]|uniref:DUF6572 domain-containing protein n=1 Tax=Pseudomonas chlororaphis group TaxID=136842 RepID=UPI000F4A9A1F|nr:DUF6572 domain-containing protein [Pseudomonas protegens]MDP9512930.1 hypothetical protein [Pseudomonas protegens]ROL90364.1 hypothetical protein BK639_20480 [Pseudomonas protegens]ROM03881.1 hypothetical protein BK642_19305 [Pseudomonas protegens]ROM05945.1 hypothetical protein BK641_14335 [Pseudomonas protegens]ROM12977.1 hypothetical protein BK640_01305 [Pseudomonas protegens]